MIGWLKSIVANPHEGKEFVPVVTPAQIQEMIVAEVVATEVTEEEPKKKKKDEYPKTVEEVLDDNIRYKKSVNEAVEKFKKSKPWHGTAEEVKNKFYTINRELAAAYDIEEPQVIFVKEFYGGSCYFPIGNLIILEQENDNRYSVVTYLHEFGHALGKNEKGTCRWSINLFRKHFPKSYAKLVGHGHLLCRKDSPRLNEEMEE